MTTDSTAVPRRAARWWAGPGRLLAAAAPAVGAYAAVRLTGFLAVAAYAWATGKAPSAVLGHSWDARWYVSIAAHGYGTTRSGESDLAFFPLLPALERGLATVLPLSLPQAGILAGWAGALAAAAGIHAVGRHLYGGATAMWLVVLWGLWPNAVVQTMAYTESLMTALSAWALYAVLTGRWLWAGSLALLAGLSRPNGFAAAAAVLTAAAAALWRDPERRRDPRVWAAPALAPLGWLAYVAWVGTRSGGPLGYFAVQRAWGSQFDFGRYNVEYLLRLLTQPALPAQYLAALTVVAAPAALVLLVRERPPLPLVIYSAALTVVALGGAHFFSSRPRFLMPAFPLLFVAARWVCRARPCVRLPLVAGCAGLSTVYGVHLLTASSVAP
ncbi:hypothetical protein HMPREF1486_00345 [Streptomyces sp. HPH0547]|uniref:hypothetical protein n=1 Tax=Streptomyces TaxID=1883 RepID=UPI00034E4C80|nr:hypothetical protein [Streptomyces sp. HPH0547]EPD97114.1 hypothetical protein HMPREF1486_00345 [Streptomyces sp. HPH0547]